MPADIPAPHPGAILREKFIEPMGISVYALAKAIQVSRSRINDICNGRQGITAAIAIRLGRFYRIDPEWFMNMQSKYDLQVQTAKLAERSPRSRSRREWPASRTRMGSQLDSPSPGKQG